MGNDKYYDLLKDWLQRLEDKFEDIEDNFKKINDKFISFHHEFEQNKEDNSKLLDSFDKEKIKILKIIEEKYQDNYKNIEKINEHMKSLKTKLDFILFFSKYKKLFRIILILMGLGIIINSIIVGLDYEKLMKIVELILKYLI